MFDVPQRQKIQIVRAVKKRLDNYVKNKIQDIMLKKKGDMKPFTLRFRWL